MRKIILLFTILLSAGLVQIVAQPVLYGLTSQGGQGIGTISKFESISNNLTAVYKFLPGSKYPFRNELIQAANGKLYGMTNQGGSSNNGTIFSFDPLTNIQTKLHDFNNTDGRYPQGSLVLASDGKLYGLTSIGGISNNGTIFSFDPVTNTQTKLHDFNSTNGGYPYGSLVQASDGKLYGMTYIGGTSGAGTIFSFDPAINTQTKLHDFNSTNGGYPYGSLVQASDGKLYGMTYNGGGSNLGTIFSFDPVSNTQTKLYDFNSTNGSYPYGSMVQANGKLYGLTSQGGISNYGTFFSFDPLTNIQTKLHDFNNTDGRYPQGSLVLASDGKLYGLTSQGGSSGVGTIFSYDPVTNTQSKLHDFNYTNGGYPYGNLTQASDGKLYGMTQTGAVSYLGTIFSFDPLTNTQTKLNDFKDINGSYPYGSLVKATNGKLYGMTSRGGVSESGTIFSFDPLTNTQTTQHDFNNTNGRYPYGSLVQAGDGKLYGMTYLGGTSGAGIIFSFDPATNTQTKLHDFNYSNGGYPFGRLVQATDGKFYGMTLQGGSSSVGTIFSFDPMTNTQTKLHDFNGTNGSNPYGSLVQASDGKLYGMTYNGGSNNYGTIFSFDQGTNTLTKLHDFNSTNGSYPNGSLVQASDGKLYGMTVQGGSSNNGTIFSFDPLTNTQTKLHDFNYANGSNPYGSLVQASDGKLYGMTYAGGTSGAGTIFSFDPGSNTQTKLQDFNSTNGGYPLYDNALIEINACTTPTPQISSNSPICNNSNLQLSASGGISYSWTGPDGFTSTDQNPLISNAVSTKAGTYTVIVSNGPTCTATASTIVVIASPLIASSIVTPNASGAVSNTILTSPSDYTFASGGSSPGNAGGRTWMFSNFNDAVYEGLWWTFNPLANPRHSTQSATGNMTFSSYDVNTGIATFTSSANMIWSANSGTENITTRLRIQFQPFTGTHNGPINSGWITPVTAGGISLASLPANYPLIDVKALAGSDNYQVWFALEEVSTGLPLNVYYATYPHTSTVGGTIVTSIGGNFFSAAPSTCNGGPSTVTVSATGGTAPYTGTGIFQVSNGNYSYTVTDALGCTSITTGTVTPPVPLVVNSIVTPNASGPVSSTTLTSPADYTFASGGSSPGNAGGRTWMFSNFNDAAYEGLWWTFNPLANPRHSTQSATGNMAFSNYDVNTGIATFTSSANMVWTANSGTESIVTRLRIQFQPHTGTHSGPINSGWITPVTAGGISLASLPANYPLIDVKALAGSDNYQVWFALEEVSTGLPLNVYYATYPHTSTVGGSIITSIGGNFFSSAPVGCGGGGSTVNITASGGTGPYYGTGSFSVLPGTYTYTVTDALGCTGTTQVTVDPQVDVNAPQITCQANISVNAPANACLASVNFTSSATDDCSVILKYYLYYGTPEEIEIQSPYNFTVGTHTVTSVALDPTNNKSTCSFIIEVKDITAPAITCITNITSNTDAGTCGAVISFTPPIGTDNCSGVVTQQISGLPSGSLFPIGQTINKYSVTDASGNSAECFFSITVEDKEKPVVHTNGIIIQLDANGAASITIAQINNGSTDNCTAVADLQLVLDKTSFDCSNVGSNTVTLTVTDGNGNVQTETAIVMVEDNEKPAITSPAPITANNDAGFCYATFTLVNPVAADNCGVQSVSNDAPVNFPVGTTTVTWTVTDNHGNTQTATQTVTVTDNEKPTISAPVAINVNNDAGNCSATVNLTAPANSDNCGIQSVTNDHPSNVYPVGTSTVTWTVTDIHGNVKTATQTVTVTDNEKPVVQTQNISVQLNSSGTAVITASSVNNGSTDNCGIQTMTVFPSAFNCTNIGANTVTLTVTDIHGNIQTKTAVVTITAMNTSSTVTVLPSSQQYSDKVTFTAEINPGVASGGCQAATHVSFKVGNKIVGTVPLTQQGNKLVGTLTVALFETVGSSDFSPGVKTVTASFTGINAAFNVNQATTSLTITKEDVRVNYTGALFVSTSCTTCSDATVTLSATIQDITATPNAAGDVDFGDIRLAKVRFINRDNNLPISGWLNVGLVNGSDIKTGAVTYNWSVNIGSVDADNFTVGIEVDNGYYIRNNSVDNVIVTVSKPLNDFVTGGGYIVPNASNGQYASDPGSKNNFGFNVKYNKTGKNLQGKLNFIIRRTESDGILHTYQIKGNSMTSLSINTSNAAALKAIFNGKANLQDITNPLSPVALGGNLTLQVEMTDRGEPGNSDSYALTVWNSSGGIAYSSNWVANRTTEMTLSSGNIQVRGAAINKTAVTGTSTITSTGNNLNLSVTEGSLNMQVKVLPNPSQHKFQLNITSNGKGIIHLRVTDIQGRIVEERKTEGSNQQITMGENWYNGSYILEVNQGGERKTMQLIKLR